MTIKFNEVTWYSKLAAAIFFLIILPVLMYYINVQYREVKTFLNEAKAPVIAGNEGTFSDPLNGTYVIDEQKITFINGLSEQEIAPGSATKIVTRVFGQPTYGDISGDGQEDAVFFVTQEMGGTGVFFYVAAAVKQGSGYKGIGGIFLGDRIAPQNINISKGIAVANFAVRAEGEAMTTRPSMGRSRFFIVRDGEFVEGEQEWVVPEAR
ncbi:MAG: hypothetical protein RLY66_46 [Candidatus Parcubacteria bacterium]|jgi:hypothetical protein